MKEIKINELKKVSATNERRQRMTKPMMNYLVGKKVTFNQRCFELINCKERFNVYINKSEDTIYLVSDPFGNYKLRKDGSGQVANKVIFSYVEHLKEKVEGSVELLETKNSKIMVIAFKIK